VTVAIGLEDAQHDGGLLLIDLALAAADLAILADGAQDAVAEGIAAARLANIFA